MVTRPKPTGFSQLRWSRSAHSGRIGYARNSPSRIAHSCKTAHVLVLAGGDVEAGWNAFTRSGLRELIEMRYRAGAVLVGVSAGTVQLGKYAAVADANSGQELRTAAASRLLNQQMPGSSSW
jgi:peptidase E